jgi:chemotaxis protein methyltransferase CheR
MAFDERRTHFLQDRLLRRLKECRADSFYAYYRLLISQQGKDELAKLLENLTVNETSFFRHKAQLDLFQKTVLEELLKHKSARREYSIRIWSAGCSTGQEAYSLAMVAMDDEALKGEFTVWGGDISRYAIEVARRGRYGPRAVASVRADYRQRFLRQVNEPGAEYEVVDQLRQRTRFMASNLVANDSFSVSYDVIFCHNVLIYFSPAAVTHAVAFLASRLTLGGYLLLGPGEAPSERPPGLVPTSINGVRAFQRRSTRSTEVRA